MDYKILMKLVDIVKVHAEERIKVDDVFEGVRAFVNKAEDDLKAKQNAFTKQELITLFANVIFSSFTLSLADELATGEEREFVDKVIEQIKPQTLNERTKH